MSDYEVIGGQTAHERAISRLFAAKDAEIAALKIALGQIANKRTWTELSINAHRDAYDDMRRIARAALEMSGGVKA